MWVGEASHLVGSYGYNPMCFLGVASSGIMSKPDMYARKWAGVFQEYPWPI